MSESSLSVEAAIEPVAGGVIGLGVGYSFAPDKFSLREYIAMPKAQFDKFYSQAMSGRLTETQKEALKTLERARSEYIKEKISHNASIRNASTLLRDEFVKIPVSKETELAYKNGKQNLQQAIADVNFKSISKKYAIAKSRFEKYSVSDVVKEAYYKANAELAKAKEFLAPKIELFKTASKKLKKERIDYITEHPEKTGTVRDALSNFNEVLKLNRARLAAKMYEQANDSNLKSAFSELKAFLPKSRMKSAIAGAGIFTLLATYWSSRISKITQKAA